MIGGRWKVFVRYHLLASTKRLSELRRPIADVSQKVLVQQLHELEERGLVHREVCDWGRADELDAAAKASR